MESKAKFLGHPIHPILIVFPLGLLGAAVVFDLLSLLLDVEALALVGYWNIAGGVIMGLVAAIFGLIDYLAIPSGTRAKSVGRWHGLGNVVVIALFAVAWFLRRDDAAHLPTTLPLVLEIGALLLALVTGWLGGELVDRLGVGVDPGANLNAPSSLSGLPAASGTQQQASRQRR